MAEEQIPHERPMDEGKEHFVQPADAIRIVSVPRKPPSPKR